MDYSQLFKDGSLKFVLKFTEKIVYDGLAAPKNQFTEAITVGLAALIIIFVLYKLVFLVWKSMKFIISCLEW